MTIEGQVVPWPPIAGRVKSLLVRATRDALLRAVRAKPREDGARRLTIFLWTAWNMGGTIRAAFNLAEYMQARGWQVDIISGYRDRDEPFFGAFPGRRAGVRPRRPPQARRRCAGCCARARACSCPTPTARCRASRCGPTSSSCAACAGARGILVGTRPGVNLMIAQLQAPGLRTVGLEQMNLAKHNKGLRKAMSAAIPTSTRSSCSPSRTATPTGGCSTAASPLHRIPNTVRPLPGAKADLGAKTVYAAGRFRYQKGFELLIPAWAETAKAHPDWRLRLRGRGHLESRYRGLIEEHGLEDSVTIEGPAEDIGADMAESAVFVLSSRFEGFPLILLEAMSKGMGIVSFDCPTGPADIVDDHRNGLLVPAEDVEALGRAIREIVEDEELRRRMAGAAIETVQQYTIEAIGPLWEELFAELSPESERA